MSKPKAPPHFRAYDEIYKIKKVKGLVFNLNHKSVYCFLLNYHYMTGKIFPSYKHIQDGLGIGSDNTVKKYLDELEEMGLVESTSRKGTSKTYKVVSLEEFEALGNTEQQQTRKQPNKNLHINEDGAQNNKGWVYESGNEAKVNTVEVATNSNSQGYRNEQIRNVGVRQEIKQDDLPDPFLDDCGVSHDSGFEEYSQPKTIKSVKPKDNAYDNGYGRKCSQCYQQPNGDWDCRDSYCNNYLPF